MAGDTRCGLMVAKTWTMYWIRTPSRTQRTITITTKTKRTWWRICRTCWSLRSHRRSTEPKSSMTWKLSWTRAGDVITISNKVKSYQGKDQGAALAAIPRAIAMSTPSTFQCHSWQSTTSTNPPYLRYPSSGQARKAVATEWKELYSQKSDQLWYSFTSFS